VSKVGKNLNSAVENFNKFGSSVTARVRPQALKLKRYSGALDDPEYPATIDGVVAPLAISEIIDGIDYIDAEEE
jgi:hypothetical protein